MTAPSEAASGPHPSGEVGPSGPASPVSEDEGSEDRLLAVPRVSRHDLWKTANSSPRPLERIWAISQLKIDLEDMLRLAVRDARRAGETWESIARYLPVTRERAWQRFHHVDKED